MSDPFARCSKAFVSRYEPSKATPQCPPTALPLDFVESADPWSVKKVPISSRTTVSKQQHATTTFSPRPDMATAQLAPLPRPTMTSPQMAPPLRSTIAPAQLAPPPPAAQRSSKTKTTSKTSNSDTQHIWIAVMGVTGAGKSSFISDCSGLSAKIGHDVVSCTEHCRALRKISHANAALGTTEVDDYEFAYAGKTIHLIDTPGFDDTYKSDREVLEGVATWLGNAYEHNITLSGILYLHRISDNRLGGVSFRNLIMFKKLCGHDFYPRVFLVTTMWDKVGMAEGDGREQTLISTSDFWGKMIQGGARTERHWGTVESAKQMLDKVIGNRRVNAPAVLKVQHEMVVEHKNLDETAAGRTFEAELLKQREMHQRELKKLQEDVTLMIEINELRTAKELEREKQAFEARIARSFEDQAELKASLEELKQKQFEELAKMKAQADQERAAYEARASRLDHAQSQLDGMDPANPVTQRLAADVAAEKARLGVRQKKLDLQAKEIGRKAKRVLISSKNWMQNHSTLIRVGLGGISLVGAAFGVPLGLVLGPLGRGMTGNGGSGAPPSGLDESDDNPDDGANDPGGNSNNGDNDSTAGQSDSATKTAENSTSDNDNPGVTGGNIQDDTVVTPPPATPETTAYSPYNVDNTSYSYTSPDAFGYSASSGSALTDTSLYANAQLYDESWASVDPGTTTITPTYDSTSTSTYDNTSLPTCSDATAGYSVPSDPTTDMYVNSMTAATTNNIAQSAITFSQNSSNQNAALADNSLMNGTLAT